MNHTAKTLLAVSAAALLGLGANLAFAADPAPTTNRDNTHHCGPMAGDMHHMMERMAKRQEKHQAALKAALKLAPEQQAAWDAYVQATHIDPQNRPQFDRKAWSGMTTLQRLDKVEEMQAQHAAHMTQRIDATRKLYAALTPEQQKVFDQQFLHPEHHDGAKEATPH